MDAGEKIKIFIGSGEASVLERKTLIYSLHKHTKRDLDIYVFNGTHNSIEHNQETPVLAPLPLKLKYLNGITEFGLYRYLLPEICQYQGKAIYLDSDIVCLADIGDLWDSNLETIDFLALANGFPELGQFLYRLSVMLINCERCRFDLNAIFDEIDRGLYSHYPDFFQTGAKFLAHHPYEIGCLDPRWNSLDYWDHETKAIHYTCLEIQPWKYHNHPYGELWFKYFYEAIDAGYIRAEDINLSIERSYVRRDIMDGNFWHKAIVKQLNRNAREVIDKVKRQFHF